MHVLFTFQWGPVYEVISTDPFALIRRWNRMSLFQDEVDTHADVLFQLLEAQHESRRVWLGIPWYGSP